MTPDPLVRRATEADIPGIRAVLAETWRDTYGAFLPPEAIERAIAAWHTPRVLAAELARVSTFAAVAEDEAGIVGVVTARGRPQVVEDGGHRRCGGVLGQPQPGGQPRSVGQRDPLVLERANCARERLDDLHLTPGRSALRSALGLAECGDGAMALRSGAAAPGSKPSAKGTVHPTPCSRVAAPSHHRHRG
ncbi:MAG: hypothetical protein K0A98_01485 [Trueperaceae bacterium]|nr:hypothetical protein [Trueperaceae bacterium]